MRVARFCWPLFRLWLPLLVFMDMRMPGMDGCAATRQIKAEAGSGEVAIVALTAGSLEGDRKQMMEAGSDAYLSKPFREQSLLDVLQNRLGVKFVFDGAAPPPHIDPAARAALPADLMERLRAALLSLEPAEIEAAIRAIAGGNAALAQALASLTQDFQYDRILALLPNPRMA